MTLDPSVKALLDGLASSQPKIWDLSPADARTMYLTLAQLVEPRDVPIGKTENREAEGPAGPIPIRVYTPVAAGGDALPGIVFFHGGGFVIGNIDTHDALCRTLANESGCRIVSVEYRLAPEHPFPAAVEDALAATRWVEANAPSLGIDPNHLGVAGDSAGGNLSAVVAQHVRKGGPKLAFQLLIYPTTQILADTDSMRDYAKGYFLERETIDWFMKHYLPEGVDHSDPRLSPLASEDVSGLAPAYIITAGFDPLRDEGKAYADRLRDAGVAVQHVDYPSMIHGFFNMQAAVPLSREAIAKAARAARAALNPE